MTLKLDETDMEIIGMLEKNAKARLHIISKKLSLPQSTVHHRIKKLEENGVIRWTIEKDFKKIGDPLRVHVMAYVNVTALKKIRKTQKDIAASLRKIRGVRSVDIVSGDSDLLITLQCRDMEDYQDILLEKIQKIDGITKTKSMIVIS